MVPNFITDTFEDAIKLIFELEGIKYEYKWNYLIIFKLKLKMIN